MLVQSHRLMAGPAFHMGMRRRCGAACLGHPVARGAQRIILGCTELPMLLSDAQMQQAGLLSSMEVHCQAIVAAALQAHE